MVPNLVVPEDPTSVVPSPVVLEDPTLVVSEVATVPTNLTAAAIIKKAVFAFNLWAVLHAWAASEFTQESVPVQESSESTEPTPVQESSDTPIPPAGTRC